MSPAFSDADEDMGVKSSWGIIRARCELVLWCETIAVEALGSSGRCRSGGCVCRYGVEHSQHGCVAVIDGGK